MTVRYGSCNFPLFSVHPGAHAFRSVGPAQDNTRHLEYRIEKSNTSALMRCEAEALWGWEYMPESDLSPEIWVVRNTSTGAVTHCWEAESGVGETPICGQQVGLRGGIESTLPPTSEIKQILIPLDDVIETLEAEIIAEALPTWVPGSEWEWVSDSETLLNFMFQKEIIFRGLRVFENIITSVYEHEMPIPTTNAYTTLWLRCASSILYDFIPVSTIIPLVIDRFIVDENGHVSL